jgi:hypothetical protein
MRKKEVIRWSAVLRWPLPGTRSGSGSRRERFRRRVRSTTVLLKTTLLRAIESPDSSAV